MPWMIDFSDLTIDVQHTRALWQKIVFIINGESIDRRDGANKAPRLNLDGLMKGNRITFLGNESTMSFLKDHAVIRIHNK